MITLTNCKEGGKRCRKAKKREKGEKWRREGGGELRREGRREGKGVPGKQSEQRCRERRVGAGGLQGSRGDPPPPPPASSSRSPFPPWRGIFLQQPHVPLFLPIAMCQNSPVLCIYPFKRHPDESSAPPKGTASFQACWVQPPFLSPRFSKPPVCFQFRYSRHLRFIVCFTASCYGVIC